MTLMQELQSIWKREPVYILYEPDTIIIIIQIKKENAAQPV